MLEKAPGEVLILATGKELSLEDLQDSFGVTNTTLYVRSQTVTSRRKESSSDEADGCYGLTEGGHEVAGVDLPGVTEVWLDLLPAGIKSALVDAPGFDVQHVETALTTTANNKMWFLVWPSLL